MSKVFINQLRKYYPDYTESELFLPFKYGRYCWVLEDKKQPYGIKVPGQTCIPEGIYRVVVTNSARWKKPMLQLYNVDEGLIVAREGISFTGIRPHGGNDVDDSEGCPICAYESDNNGKVWNRASDDLFDYVSAHIDDGREIYWIISSS